MFDIPLSLYIHIPWCMSKCPYCDFNSYGIAQHPMQEQDYVKALCEDMRSSQHLAQGRSLGSLFFGGGTPSLFSATSIEKLIASAQRIYGFTQDIEITLEANPGTFEAEKFRDFVRAGVNRISLGVQSFDDAQLKRLGRVHTSHEARQALETLQTIGLNSFNIDLMYALPEQSVEGALADLASACEYAPKHLSWYHLTMEPNTVFYQNPPKNLPNEDRVIEMEEAGRAYLAERGLARYEVSAYAQPGHRSLHNLNYWEFGDYLALGAGAHGKITDLNTGVITRYCKQKTPRNYLDRALPYTSNETVVIPEDLALEFMMNGLRLSEGIPLPFFTARSVGAEAMLHSGLQQGLERGLLRVVQDRVSTTDLGARFLNDVVNLFA